MKLTSALPAIALVFLVSACAPALGPNNSDSDEGGNDSSDAIDVGANDEEFEPEFEGDCVVDESFAPLLDSLPAGYELLSAPDCIYDSGETYSLVYLDGGNAAIDANNSALSAAGWEEVDTNTWDNQDVGTVSQGVYGPEENPGGIPFGWKDTYTLVGLLPY